MDGKKFDIIMFNMSPWRDWQKGIVNRNFFILENLRKQNSVNKIIAVDFLPIKFKQAAKYYFKDILLGLKNKKIISGDLTSVSYRYSEKIYVHSTIDSIFSTRKVTKKINKLIKKTNLSENLIVWSYNPMFVNFIESINYKLFVFDTVDNWTEHTQYLKIMNKQKLLNRYKLISGKADLIFTVSEGLLDFYKSFDRTENIYWIANGVDFDHFNDENNLAKETAIDNIDKPIIGYIGTIQDRLDFDLIKYIAEKNPDKTIVLGGPIWKNVEKEVEEKLKSLSNIEFLGRIDWNYTPAYVNKFDVCFIPHKPNKFVESMNPMKMYEYLSLGKPIVTTKGGGVDSFSDYLYIANDYEKFNQLINKALDEDSVELKEKRMDIAKKQSWEVRVNKMVHLIQNKL